MTNKHTPGPWRTNSDAMRTNRAYVWVWGANGEVIYRRQILDRQTDESNARLIAAAPDLLAALREAHDVIEETHYKCDPLDDEYCAVEASSEHAILREIRAAIARATGDAS